MATSIHATILARPPGLYVQRLRVDIREATQVAPGRADECAKV